MSYVFSYAMNYWFYFISELCFRVYFSPNKVDKDGRRLIIGRLGNVFIMLLRMYVWIIHGTDKILAETIKTK